jgi:hypothetical protein
MEIFSAINELDQSNTAVIKAITAMYGDWRKDIATLAAIDFKIGKLAIEVVIYFVNKLKNKSPQA